MQVSLINQDGNASLMDHPVKEVVIQDGPYKTVKIFENPEQPGLISTSTDMYETHNSLCEVK